MRGPMKRLRRLGPLAILAVAVLLFDVAPNDEAGAGSVTIRTYRRTTTTYQGWSSYSYGGGGSCGGWGVCPDGTCAPLGSTCCGNASHCAGNQICIENGTQCLARDSERVCSNGSYCDAGFMCMNDGRCLSVLSDRYCGDGRYCDAGFVCQSDDTCRSEAAIAAEETERRLEDEREREEAARAEEERQRRVAEEAEAERRRQEEAAARLRPHMAPPSLLGVPPSMSPKRETQVAGKAPAPQSHLSAGLPPAPHPPGTTPASPSLAPAHLAASLPPPRRAEGTKVASRDTSNGTIPPPAAPLAPPVQMTAQGMTVTSPANNPGGSGAGSGNSNSNNIPTPCQDLRGPSGCQNSGGVVLRSAPSAPGGVRQAAPRTTPPNNVANDLGDAGRTVQEILGTLPNSNNSVPFEQGIPGVSPSSSSPSLGSVSSPPRRDASLPPAANEAKSDPTSEKDDDHSELTEEEAKVCRQAFKEYLSGENSGSERLRKAKEFWASLRSFKKLKEWMRDQFKDWIDDHVTEILKKAIEDDVGKNRMHEIEDAKRFNEKLRDCDRAALKTFNDGIDEYLKESVEAVDEP
jgi:hypothetical protein